MGPTFTSPVDTWPVDIGSANIGLPSLGRERWGILDSLPPDLLISLSDQYRSANPFPHIVIDHLFESQMLEEIEQAFGTVSPEFWSESRHRLQSKRSTVAAAPLPAIARHYFDQLSSAPMCRFLSAITGIEDLHGDPALVNGGLHEVSKGGCFDLHTDFPYHPEMRWRSRLVMITYLNKGWLAEFGGCAGTLGVAATAVIDGGAAHFRTNPYYGSRTAQRPRPPAIHRHTG
ncbi:hypothetical protein BH09PSE3_BH09PSE3_10350 [soil metagenome]